MPKKVYFGVKMAVFGPNILIILLGIKSSSTHLGTSLALFYLSDRAPNKLARPICAQESMFWGQNGRFWAKHPNCVGTEQKFWYPHIRKPLRHLVRIVFWSGMAPNGPVRPIFGR